jgi:peptidoglycan/xylan/chitin deacetylase (PgdA/CDA1 family)
MRLARKVRNYYIRNSWRYLYKRPFTIRTKAPIISFTFDDFPRSAIGIAGTILEGFGCRGTYYASLGLMGKYAPTGEMFLEEDLHAVLSQGHELGCHTFDHSHSWETRPSAFASSVAANQAALDKFIPGLRFRTFSYPISTPRLQNKRIIGQRFLCCRGGGQTFNAGTVDLGYLAAFFLEKSRDNLPAIKNIIDRNRQACGWLIFATHDVCEDPTPYGCTPELFTKVVDLATKSGAQVLTVADAMRALDGL